MRLISIAAQCGAALAFACAALVAQAEAPPIFVLNSLDATVSVIDPETWTEKQRIPTGKEPHHLYLTPDESSLIVANSASDSLTFLNPRTAEVQRVVYGIIDPYHLRFSPDMKWFVTAGNRLNHIDVYRWDGQNLKLAKRIPSGKTPSHIWIDGRSTTAYVTMQDSDELVAVDIATQTIRWRMPTGPMPADVFGIRGGTILLVGLTGSDGVQVIDVSQPVPQAIGKIPTGKGAHAFRATGDGRSVFVSNRVENSISRIDLDTLRVTDTYPVPGGPDCMDVSDDQKTLYVTSRWAKKLSVIDIPSRKLKRQVAVGRSPHGVWTLAHAGR
ncbi:MAG: beta-propeller fold lactonase family protein [Gammaproteobacteria bacterium]|nr:beta-propeller fold lactonase family protein [Gammaproteobacteria bacterium]MBU1439989.1 beta-propeller fold lactonase family protein [Gammaproteobacteria bacterium]MBU2286264.1 beta-propeller fold lactonase family protein [Gammaproteobacteria bacterium]MBU2409955.1 beta-propeller fold lactonase family protein [Gammaproteobacteria bacterium]